MEQLNQVIADVTREVFETMITANVEVVTAESDLVLEATREVFAAMITTDLRVAETPAWRPDVTAMIGLGGQRPGIVAINCPKETASFIARTMLGDPGMELSNSDLKDALGEVTNMIAGNIKVWFNNQGISCLLSVPTVITGTQFDIDVMAGGKRQTVGFNTEGYPFNVELILGED